MAAYRLSLKTSAAREIENLERKDRERVVTRIGCLAHAPRPEGAEKLAGHENAYRIRQGVYRIVYVIDDDGREVTVIRVGHRREVYRR